MNSTLQSVTDSRTAETRGCDSRPAPCSSVRSEIFKNPNKTPSKYFPISLAYTQAVAYSLGVKDNKYQIKANNEKLARIKSGELTRIADRAIAAARAEMVKGSHTIDASEMVASSNPLEAHIGSQMDGYTVSGKISAKVELDSAAREIVKLGTINKVITPEAMTEWNRVEAVAAELGLNEE